MESFNILVLTQTLQPFDMILVTETQAGGQGWYNASLVLGSDCEASLNRAELISTL